MGNEVVVIPLDEYRALCSMEGRVNALRDLARRNRYISTEDALRIMLENRKNDIDEQELIEFGVKRGTVQDRKRKGWEAAEREEEYGRNESNH